MVIAYSTQADQLAIDGKGRNSPFAAALVKEIGAPGIEIGTMFRRVAADVSDATQGHQLPELSISLIGDFYLNNSDTDVQAWAKLRGSTDSDRLRRFISRYPGSPLATDIQDRLAFSNGLNKHVSTKHNRRRLNEIASNRNVWQRRRPIANSRQWSKLSGIDWRPSKLNMIDFEKKRLAKEQADRDRVAQEQADLAAAANRPPSLPPSPKTNHRHKWQRPRKPLSVRHRVQAGPSPWVRINLQYRLRC